MICPLGELQEPGVRGLWWHAEGGISGADGLYDSLHLVPSCHDRMNLVEESSSRREGAAGEPGGNGAGERASPMSGFVGKAINMPAGSSHASVSGVVGWGMEGSWGVGCLVGGVLVV